VPYGIAASLAYPDRKVLVATGDGAFGFNAIEIDTAVRHNAPVVIVVANNGASQIEVHNQTVTHGKVVGTRLQFSDHAGMARAFGPLPARKRARCQRRSPALMPERYACSPRVTSRRAVAWQAGETLTSFVHPQPGEVGR
jgi:thiamine pyrophosphate-dependent acetolactate synthase large subunit-like protein